MKRENLRTFLLLTLLFVFSITRLQLSGDESVPAYLLPVVWGCLLLLGTAGILLSVREDKHDFLVFTALVVVALFFTGSYMGNIYLRKESAEAIASILALSKDSYPCEGSDVWLTLGIPIKDDKDVKKFENFLEEFNLSPHLQDKDTIENTAYVSMCAMGKSSELPGMERKAPELGWSYYVTNLTALRQKTYREEVADENTIRIDFFIQASMGHTESYFTCISRKLTGVGIILSLLGLLLRLPRGE